MATHSEKIIAGSQADRPMEPLDSDSAALQEVERFVMSRINFERIPAERYELKDFKLERMRQLLGQLGNPQRSLPAIHIAGTKGKGSTAAMSASILRSAGWRVGLFTSPHLETLGERMTVNGQVPTGESLHEVLEVLRPEVDRLDRVGEAMRPTFFEVLTAMAWLHFVREQVDFVVLEVGLGGRLDATNVCDPLVSIVTSISYDHQRLLGHTLAQIAGEKAGIIRPRVPVMSGAITPEPREVIRQTCRTQGAPLYELQSEIRYQQSDESHLPEQPWDILSGSTLDVTTPWRSHAGLRIPLAGRHQLANASLAVAATDAVHTQGRKVPQEAVEQGLAAVTWPLRVEVAARAPLTILDAAHNDGSVRALIDVLSELRVGQRWLIFGTSRDKDVARMLQLLGPEFDHIILTRYVGNPRALALPELRSIAARVLARPVESAENPQAAWQLVTSRAEVSDLVCVAGSLFLGVEMRQILRVATGNTAATAHACPETCLTPVPHDSSAVIPSSPRRIGDDTVEV